MKKALLVCILCVIVMIFASCSISAGDIKEWNNYCKYMTQVWQGLGVIFPIAIAFSIFATAFLGLFALIAGKGCLGFGLLAMAILSLTVIGMVLVAFNSVREKAKKQKEERKKEKEKEKEKNKQCLC